eukprot:COSAG05_NODE_1395_length_4993_cov_6.265836_12_plen_60_part_01
MLGSGVEVGFGRQAAGLAQRHWLNQRRNFDHIFAALLVMFELLTLEEWDAVMYHLLPLPS